MSDNAQTLAQKLSIHPLQYINWWDQKVFGLKLSMLSWKEDSSLQSKAENWFQMILLQAKL